MEGGGWRTEVDWELGDLELETAGQGSTATHLPSSCCYVYGARKAYSPALGTPNLME